MLSKYIVRYGYTESGAVSPGGGGVGREGGRSEVSLPACNIVSYTSMKFCVSAPF